MFDEKVDNEYEEIFEPDKDDGHHSDDSWHFDVPCDGHPVGLHRLRNRHRTVDHRGGL